MRGRTWISRGRGFEAATILFWIGCLLVPMLGRAAAVTPTDEYLKLISAGQKIRPMGAHPFGESINLYSGALSFEVPDVSVPGTGPALQLSRSINTGAIPLKYGLDLERPFGDWDLDIPRIETYTANQANVTGWYVASYGNAGYLDRCTEFKAPPPVNSTQGAPPWSPHQWWYGYNLIVPGQGSQKLLLRVPQNTLAPANGGSYPIVTTNNWQITCGVTASDGGQGFVAVAPDGTRYTFAHLVYRPLPFLQKPLTQGPDAVSAGSVTPLVAPFDIIGRREALMYVTQVEDRFGNTLTYNWSSDDPNSPVDDHLTSIVASDGREIELTYYQGTSLIHTVTVEPAGGAARRIWTYSYDTTGVNPTLTRVQLPDGSAWTYHFAGLLTAPVTANYYDCINDTPNEVSGGAVATATAPSGLTATFTLSAILHGRSHVPEICVRTHTGASYPEIPDEFAELSLMKETLTGPGIPTETWTYSYSAPNASWTRDHCGHRCPSTVYVDVTDPLGQDVRYTYSNRFDASEGKLLRTDTYSSGGGKADLRAVVNTYANPTGGPWPADYGIPLQAYTNHAQTTEVSPLQTRTITQDGVTFTTRVDAFDDFAQATNTTESSSLGYSKTDTTSFDNDLNHWVLGLVEQTTTNGIVDSQTSFDSLDQPTSAYAFGRLVSTKAWNADGTLASQTDGDGHTTRFSNWYRGLPGTITFADGTHESAAVNGDGWITALTDENGFTTHYAYDPMGRLTEIAYPSGDDVAWNPTDLSFTQVGSTELGIPAGHWKQVIHTGNDYAVTYFNAFWQPLITERYDAGNVGSTLSTVVQHYDPVGRKVFVSYPVRRATSFAQSLPGIHTSYDALDRITDVAQDSSLGLLPTTTQYLSGFKTEVTDPRGYSTITSYLAYGTPTTQWPVSIAAPADELTRITRDVFGKPLAITRTGAAAGSPSVTRSFTYNAYQQLCGRTEPETGTTAFGYDAAGNLTWSASGLGAGTGACYGESQASGSGRMVTRAYDARNRITAIDYPDGFSNTRYGYASDGALLSASVADGGFPVTTTYTWDKRRLLTSETQNLPNALPSTLQYGYDANGHLAATAYPDGRLVGYMPNALGQPTQAGAYASNVHYYPNGAIAGFTYRDGALHTMTEDERGLIGRSTDTLNGTAGMDFAYDYDGDGNVAAITDYLPGSVGNVNMTYDALDRLVEADSPMFGGDGKALYGYDALNNLRSARVGNRSSFDYVYNANDQLAELTDPSSGLALVDYSYDAQGNLARKNTQAYRFDLADRLASVPGVANYRYDAAGRRVQKVETAYGKTLDSDYSQAGNLMYQFDPANVDSTDYVYLGSTLVARVVGNDSEVIGSINGISTDATPLLTGWACSTGISAPISVEVFVGGPSGGGGTRIATVTANQVSGSAGASACHTQGTSYGFSIPLDTAIRAQYGGQPIYVYGDSPVGNANNELQGSGMYSVPPNPGVPQAPAQIVVPSTNSTGEVTVSWSASDTATHYVLQQQFNDGNWTQVYDGTATSTTLSGLGNGKYVYRVQACNTNGCSAFTMSSTLTVALVPAPPASINVPASSYTASFTVSWSASANATNYVLEESASGGAWGEVYSGAATSTTVTVDASGSYRFQVAACEAGGCSTFTVSGNVAVTLPPSTAPTLSGPPSSGTGSFGLSWTMVAGATRYQLKQNLNGSVSVVYDAGGTSWSASGLGNGTYDYQVSACNAAGCGPGSATLVVTVALIPAPPASISVPANSYSPALAVSWSASANATNYVLEESFDGGSWGVAYSGDVTGTTVTVASSGTYRFQVAACSAGGCSGFTTSNDVTVTLPPAAPTLSGPSSSATGTFTLTWNAVSGASGYRLNQNLDGTVSTIYSGSDTSWSSGNLGDGTYDYQVFACNVAGCTGGNVITVDVQHVPVAPAYVTAPQRVPYPGNPWLISIAPVSGASSYSLRRTNLGSTGSPTTIITGVGTSAYDYTTPGTYQYAAQACNASGCSGWTAAGNTTTVFCATTTTALQPAGISPQIMQCGGTP